MPAGMHSSITISSSQELQSSHAQELLTAFKCWTLKTAVEFHWTMGIFIACFIYMSLVPVMNPSYCRPFSKEYPSDWNVFFPPHRVQFPIVAVKMHYCAIII